MIDQKETLCNLCGECVCHDITVPSGRWKADSPHGLYNAKVNGGYESYHLFDMTSYTFSLCEKCLRQLFIQCKIKPEIHDQNIGENFEYVEGDALTWDQDQEAYEYRLWKDAGGHHNAYLNRKCNFKKDCPNEAIYTQFISEEFTEGCCCEEHKNLYPYTNSSLVKFIPDVLKPFL